MNAEISAYSSGNLSKYEYLTNKDLGYKPDACEKAKFEYSPLGKVFTDGLNKTDKKEGLLKRSKNIESKSNNQLLALKNINKLALRGRDMIKMMIMMTLIKHIKNLLKIIKIIK